jgi:Arc/MetJ family transcription regulator
MRKEYDFSKGKRGAVIPTLPGKTRITIRIDDDILAWFRAQVHAAGGGNYQALINSALRQIISSRQEALEDTLRRVLREELAVHEGGNTYVRSKSGDPA